MRTEEMYMKRALELAELGRGMVSPNPMVGCVIVHNDQIIGEGYHQNYGGLHAEPNAINDVKDLSLLPEAVLYVTLEPCSHHGKTPPCAELLVEKKINKVFIATGDPNPLVSGKGIGILKHAGIEVKTGILEKEARIQNKRFFTQVEKHRPYILLKWAQTQNGFIAKPDFDSKWISNAYSRQLVHKWRTEEDAILVGTNTARYDNPQLNARDWEGKNPVRLVIDKNLDLDRSCHLLDGKQLTICYNHIKSEEGENLIYVKLPKDFTLPTLLEDLHSRKIQSLIVEGGAFLLNRFLEIGLWDEARVFVGNRIFEDGIPAPSIQAVCSEFIQIMEDKLLIYYH